MTPIKKKFKYKPISLKDILRQMKQNIDLMIDLAYSAIKFGSKELANEVYKIEQNIHELTFLLNFQIIQTQAGGFEKAKKLQPIVVMGYSIDKISDALSDIARVIFINSDIADFTQLMWDYVPEPIVKIRVHEGCDFTNQDKKDIHFRSKHGVDLIAIRRKKKWSFDKNDKVLINDILIVKGEKEPIMQLKKDCHDDDPISFDLEKGTKKSAFDIKDPEIQEMFTNIKKNYVKITDMSETMTELALASLFFNNYEVAEDVLEMEELMDGLNINFEKDLLELASLIKNPRDLTGILRIVFSCELIADAAQNIAESIVKGFEPHRILQQAITETSEIVVRETLSSDSFFRGKTYKELQDNKYKRGFHIIALKRENKWIYSFKPDFTFDKNDLIISLGPKETVQEWKKCVNPQKFIEKN
ncbi:MAG: hypothetical protein KGD57_05645 [Candidatus Lokiarchaeota archaeon]|nr:hypothetical protein [Candidatus Lokiarchaeota archaeon]